MQKLAPFYCLYLRCRRWCFAIHSERIATALSVHRTDFVESPAKGCSLSKDSINSNTRTHSPLQDIISLGPLHLVTVASFCHLVCTSASPFPATALLYFWVLHSSILRVLCINEIMQCFDFYVWLMPLSIMSSRFTHSVTKDRVLFFSEIE